MSTQSNLLVLAAIVSALAASDAHAQSSAVREIAATPASGDRLVRTETITYADLDVSREAGSKALLARITGAAKTVCAPAPQYGESRAPYDACVKSAVEHAMAQINRTTVVAQLQGPARNPR